jgi:homoserine O-acetyltransferase/O-succinyltransferase
MLLFASALLFANLGDFTLDSGKKLENAKVGYRTYGTLNADKSNAIVFPTWFNGTTEGLETYLTGPNAFIDISKYFVITMDAFGNGVSTSPTNSETQANKLFPRITIKDMVRSQHQVVTKTLGIQKLYAVAGISMGGMQTFQWLASYPDMIQNAVSIVGTPRMTERDIILWTAFVNKMPGMGGRREEARGDQGGGQSGGQGGGQSGGQGGGQGGGTAQAGGGGGGISSMVLGGLGMILGSRKGGGGGGSSMPMPLNALKQFEAMVTHDITKDYGRSLDKAAKAIPAKVLLIVAESDEAVDGALPKQFAQLKSAPLVLIPAPAGHNAFKNEKELISKAIGAFFAGEDPLRPGKKLEPPQRSIFSVKP